MIAEWVLVLLQIILQFGVIALLALFVIAVLVPTPVFNPEDWQEEKKS